MSTLYRRDGGIRLRRIGHAFHTTFDVYYPSQARFEVYGSEGTLLVPDPNTFGGPVCLYRPESKEVRELPLVFDYSENSRGLGLADMANALRDGRTRPRADYTQTFHVLEAIEGFETSGKTGAWVELASASQFTPLGPDEKSRRTWHTGLNQTPDGDSLS